MTTQLDQAKPHHIKLEHVQLVRVLRKANPRPRWSAVSETGNYLNQCVSYRWGEGPSKNKHPPLALPLHRCSIPESLVERIRITRGAAEVKRTFGVGYKAMLAEIRGGLQ